MNEFKIVHTDNTEKSRRELIEALKQGFTILDSVFVGNMRVQYVLGKTVNKYRNTEVTDAMKEALGAEEPVEEVLATDKEE